MIRKLFIVTGVIAALAASVAYAEGFGSPSVSSDSRIRVVPYSENDVYTIAAKVGYQTTIVFGDDEEIQTISVGDRSPWQIIPSGSRLFIRPLVEGVVTNMSLITNKNTYQFDLKSAAKESGSVMYVLKFSYDDAKASSHAYPAPVTSASPFTQPVPFTSPASPVPVRAPEPPKPESHYGQSNPQNPNYNYTYSGPDDLAPLRAYDDGVSTYVTYRNSGQPMPNAYRVDESGNEVAVVSHVSGETLVIEAVAGKISLKNSNGTVYIYNETINPR